MSRILPAGSALLLAGTLALAGLSGCGSGEGNAQEGATVTSTQTVTEPPTPTRPQSNPPPASQTPPSAPPKQTVKPPADAESTVKAYFAAVNARDFRRAWELGGKSLGGSFESFQAGFADTARDSVSIVDVSGNTVSVTLDALQTDGTVRQYAGSYTVSGGVITGAAIEELGDSTPSPQDTAPGQTPNDENSKLYPPGPPAGVPDVDCPDLDGPVWVGDDDPHRLDADGDGIGCDIN
ncbi:hypothetical protein [Streptomyces sp. NPDC017993]|uniref:hypothetical protein n=1 Tax=Streptomyces sp. NPDC017993 TaxID=3365027 RepID=UPI00379F955E